MTATTYMKPAADVKRFAMRGSHTGNTHPKEIALTNPEESTVGTENTHVREVRTGDHAAETAALECWVDEDLSKSGLTRDDFEVVPFAPETTRDGHELNNGGYCIVYRNEDGTEMIGSNGRPYVRQRFRPPLPELKGVRAKYATPPRAGNRCFIQKSVYEYLTADPTAPIYLTEGEKKAAKATKEGFPVIGLSGIWNWLAPAQDRKSVSGKYKINADIVQFLNPGRAVVIIYDSDSKDSRNKAAGFDLNTLRLASELLEYKCPLYRVDVPQETEEKCGLDDYLLTRTADDFRKHIAATRQVIPEELALSVRDPYKEVTKQEGEPYHIKWTQSDEVTKVTLTQGWNARFLMQNHDLLYEPGEARSFMYNDANGLWEGKSEDFLKRLLADELGEYWKKFHFSDAHVLLPSRNDRVLKDSINQLRGMAEKEGAFSRLDNPGPVVHLKEGMLDLETLTLKDFSPKYYSRNQIAVPFDENADCPCFLNELLAPALSDDAIYVAQKYFGMCVMGYNYSQQFLLLEGTAGGGKGTLTDILRRIVGQMNVAEMRTHQLNERFELAAFFDKTLLIGSDVPGNFLQRAGAEVIKKLTGHDLIEAEFKGANKRGRMKGIFNAVITSNNRLRVRLDGDEDAWRRRMILLRFVQPPVEKKIVNFAEKLLQKEDTGILNWMIHGAVKALADFKEYGRINVPEALQNDADELLYESNSLNNFLDERVVASQGGSVSTEELQSAYVAYCNSKDVPALPSLTVAKRLIELMRQKFCAPGCNNISRGGGFVRGYRNVAIVC